MKRERGMNGEGDREGDREKRDRESRSSEGYTHGKRMSNDYYFFGFGFGFGFVGNEELNENFK